MFKAIAAGLVVIGSSLAGLCETAQAQYCGRIPWNIQPVPALGIWGVQFFEHVDYKGEHLTVPMGHDICDLHKIASDEGGRKFGDKASGLKWNIPMGYRAIVYRDKDFKSTPLILVGKGSYANLKPLSWNDAASSIRFERIPQ